MAKMEWVSTADGMPERDGNYIVRTAAGSLQMLPYSTKYGAFNTRDKMSEDEAEFCSIDCEKWMPLYEGATDEELWSHNECELIAMYIWFTVKALIPEAI